jgi:hypothetical protein
VLALSIPFAIGRVDFDTLAGNCSLQETMDAISEKVETRGLTPEILKSTLRKK